MTRYILRLPHQFKMEIIGDVCVSMRDSNLNYPATDILFRVFGKDELGYEILADIFNIRVSEMFIRSKPWICAELRNKLQTYIDNPKGIEICIEWRANDE